MGDLASLANDKTRSVYNRISDFWASDTFDYVVEMMDEIYKNEKQGILEQMKGLQKTENES